MAEMGGLVDAIKLYENNIFLRAWVITFAGHSASLGTEPQMWLTAFLEDAFAYHGCGGIPGCRTQPRPEARSKTEMSATWLLWGLRGRAPALWIS